MGSRDKKRRLLVKPRQEPDPHWGQIARFPRSPVRSRTASTTSSTKIFPSPRFPVRAVRSMASIACPTRSSWMTTSIFAFGTKSTMYSAPRYSSLWPFWRPKPFTSLTVMPLTPTELRASFTSSTREGRMIASIFFISALSQRAHQRAAASARRLVARKLLADHRTAEHVRVLRVLRKIQSGDFVVLAYAHADQRVDDLQDHVRHRRGQRDGREHRQQLRPELAGIAVEQAVGAPAVDRLPGKEAGGERAPGAAHAVHAH